mmetsp:Transcript_35066/g.105735  ORF Transcript_35066/g.105735 Transcript_35066/m.105735 type:complete len:208 (-) Transcript_35066:207-830(-)
MSNRRSSAASDCTGSAGVCSPHGYTRAPPKGRPPNSGPAETQKGAAGGSAAAAAAASSPPSVSSGGSGKHVTPALCKSAAMRSLKALRSGSVNRSPLPITGTMFTKGWSSRRTAASRGLRPWPVGAMKYSKQCTRLSGSTTSRSTLASLSMWAASRREISVWSGSQQSVLSRLVPKPGVSIKVSVSRTPSSVRTNVCAVGLAVGGTR